LPPVRPVALVVAALALLALPAAAGAATTKPKTRYYLSLGDSLSVGVQPGPADDPGNRGRDANTEEGYTDQLYAKARKRLFPALKLVKAGCGGATTDSFINGGPGVTGGPNCYPRRKLAYRNVSPRTSQLAYAERFLRSNRGRVAFVTVDIGNNNFTACADNGVIDVACVAQGIQSLNEQLPAIAQRLRRAAGRSTPIVGATFYQPFYSIWLQGGAQQQLAETLQPTTQSVNEGIAAAYATARIKVAPIDRAFKSYVPFSQTQPYQGLDPIPVSVATVCTYSWNCTPAPVGPNIHANETGYGVIASQFYAVLKAGL